ncbi:hypothetical protein NPA07_00120 [Mycoplasmopsis caviae]|uniref:Uncharacterized protein involved in cytokinesis, contains TGc (Transglutaminase/protease-like) domain n=1 Tax=Mycoplasmopsis caviae TaxID=55603 RepID=A0A3P8LAQ6_9BACT|nr:transglutaminase domain-containing protein [Mycoplasmopsis caviae]UUD35275.1 hypothetical protein NPA07_00120 [Mycoplasmopsis caviae]VDR41941.1 Uncharacterized protein involved in cytokinesis, contains TGc (transglutaminase/protease-like) domain [Mycoplasmopsis caviae]
MKKRRHLLYLSMCSFLPIFISQSCNKTDNKPTNSLNHSNQINKTEPKKESKPWIELTPAKTTNPTSSSNNVIETINEKFIPNWIDPKLELKELKEKIWNLKHNYGFVNSVKNLNAESISLSKGKAFQITLDNQNLKPNEIDLFIKHNGHIHTLDEYNNLASRKLNISNTGFITCIENSPSSWMNDYDDYLWIREKSTNSYFSLKVTVKKVDQAYLEAFIEKGEEHFKRIATYFANIDNKVDRLLAIKNYVLDLIDYDFKNTRVGKIEQDYFAIIEKKGVCAAYTKLINRIANYSGLEDIFYNYGNIRRGENLGSIYGATHAWNKVKIDGHWYYLDATWSDSAGVKAYRGKNDMNYFLLNSADMQKSRDGIIDSGLNPKDYKFYPFIKEGTYANNIDEVKKSIRNQILSSSNKNNYYNFSLVYPENLHQQVLGLIGNSNIRNMKLFGHIYARITTSTSLLATIFSDLNFTNIQNVEVKSVSFVNNNSLEVTFSQEVKNLSQNSFKLTFLDTLGVEIPYADIEKFEISEGGKKVKLTFKNQINLDHINNANINLSISVLGYNFDFKNSQNYLSYHKNSLANVPIEYSILQGTKAQFKNITADSIYSLDNGKKWHKVNSDLIIDVGLVGDNILIQKVDNTTKRTISIQKIPLKRYNLFSTPTFTNDKKFIVNVNNLMEYKIDNEEVWHSVTKNYIEVKDPNKKYKVRFKADINNKIFASGSKK